MYTEVNKNNVGLIVALIVVSAFNIMMIVDLVRSTYDYCSYYNFSLSGCEKYKLFWR